MNRPALKRFSFFVVLIAVAALSVATAQASLVVELILELKETHVTLEELRAGPTWLVLNSSGTTATELKASLLVEKESTHLTILTHLLGIAPSVTCTNFELIGFNLETEGKLTTGAKIKFTGCEAYGKGSLEEPLSCKVHSPGQAAGTLESNKLKGELYLHINVKGEPEETLIKIEPEVAGGAFKTFLTEGCALPEVIVLKGVIYLRDATGEINTHLVKHLIEAGPRTSLYLGSHNVEHLNTSLIGSGWLKLSGAHSGLKWSAMNP